MNSSVSFSESDGETPSRNGTEKRKEHDKLKLEVKDVRDRTSAENLFNSNEEFERFAPILRACTVRGMIDAILILTGKKAMDESFLEASEYLRQKIQAHKSCEGCESNSAGDGGEPLLDNPKYHNSFRTDMFLPRRRDVSTSTASSDVSADSLFFTCEKCRCSHTAVFVAKEAASIVDSSEGEVSTTVVSARAAKAAAQRIRRRSLTPRRQVARKPVKRRRTSTASVEVEKPVIIAADSSTRSTDDASPEIIVLTDETCERSTRRTEVQKEQSPSGRTTSANAATSSTTNRPFSGQSRGKIPSLAADRVNVKIKHRTPISRKASTTSTISEKEPKMEVPEALTKTNTVVELSKKKRNVCFNTEANQIFEYEQEPRGDVHLSGDDHHRRHGSPSSSASSSSSKRYYDRESDADLFAERVRRLARERHPKFDSSSLSPFSGSSASSLRGSASPVFTKNGKVINTRPKSSKPCVHDYDVVDKEVADAFSRGAYRSSNSSIRKEDRPSSSRWLITKPFTSLSKRSDALRWYASRQQRIQRMASRKRFASQLDQTLSDNGGRSAADSRRSPEDDQSSAASEDTYTSDEDASPPTCFNTFRGGRRGAYRGRRSSLLHRPPPRRIVDNTRYTNTSEFNHPGHYHHYNQPPTFNAPGVPPQMYAQIPSMPPINATSFPGVFPPVDDPTKKYSTYRNNPNSGYL